MYTPTIMDLVGLAAILVGILAPLGGFILVCPFLPVPPGSGDDE